MSLGVPPARLKDGLKELRIAWGRTKEEWSDQASIKFEQEFIATIDSKVHAAITAMGRLSEVLDAARRECDKER